MSEIQKIIIPGDVFSDKGVYNLDVKLDKNKNFFIMGTIYNNFNEPISDAAVAVYRIEDIEYRKKSLIAVTFTCRDGTYGISLPIGYSYILMIYS